MMYSKNGSIPKPQTDGTDGWIEVPEAPTAGAGQEVVWWYPPGWVVRPVMPVKEGFGYNWSQSEGKWVEHQIVDTIDLTSTAVAFEGSDATTMSGTGGINV